MPHSQTADKTVSPRLAKSGNDTFTKCRQTRVNTSDSVWKCHIYKLQTNLCHHVWLSLEMPHSQNADKPVSPRLPMSGNATFTNCGQTRVTTSGLVGIYDIHKLQTNPCHRFWLSLEMPLLQTADKPVSSRLAKSGNATFTNCRQNLSHRVLLNLEMPHSQTADKPVLSRLAKSGNATFTNCRQIYVTTTG